jgi:hypothetical protein
LRYPAAVRIEPEVPCDPYDVSAWPIRRLPRGLAEARYQLHTRDIELLPFVRLLSKKFAALTFSLVTFCLDDGEVASYRVCGGRAREWILPRSRRDAHWERACPKFGLVGDDVYQHDEAERFAVEAMLEEALAGGEPASKELQNSRRRVRSWWNRPVTRDIMTEKTIAVAELSGRLRGDKKDKRSRASNRSQADPTD